MTFHLTKKDWTILALTFVLILLIAPLPFMIDETPLESALPWFFGIPMMIGAVLFVPINWLLMGVLSLLGREEIILYSDVYFTSILPLIVATFYTVLLAIALGSEKTPSIKKGIAIGAGVLAAGILFTSVFGFMTSVDTQPVVEQDQIAM